MSSALVEAVHCQVTAVLRSCTKYVLLQLVALAAFVSIRKSLFQHCFKQDVEQADTGELVMEQPIERKSAAPYPQNVEAQVSLQLSSAKAWRHPTFHFQPESRVSLILLEVLHMMTGTYNRVYTCDVNQVKSQPVWSQHVAHVTFSTGSGAEEFEASRAAAQGFGTAHWLSQGQTASSFDHL